MTALLDSIRRIVAEDAAHSGTTHELYLTQPTVYALTQSGDVATSARFDRKRTVEGLSFSIQNVGRDCIATLRNGRIISVTNL